MDRAHQFEEMLGSLRERLPELQQNIDSKVPGAGAEATSGHKSGDGIEAGRPGPPPL